MTGTRFPADEAELAAILAEAAARQTPLAISGGGTRAGLGRPVQAAADLSARAIAGITLYEPAELVLSARAGTPLAEVEAALAKNGQRFAFEPVDHRRFYGSEGEPTIGGLAATNVSGPRRVSAGAVRDAMIGIRAVTGRGEAIKSGGRVMKNVTGYDLVKFFAGSFGTLGVLTEVTFKLQPAPETESTLVLSGLDATKAVAALTAGLNTPWEVSGAAHLPGDTGPAVGRTLFRLEGFAGSVAIRSDNLRHHLRSFGEAQIVEGSEASREIWQGVGDLSALGASANAPVWRVSVGPQAAPGIAEAARRAFPVRTLFDWGGALLFIALESGGPHPPDAGASVIRAAAAAAGGHATLIRATSDLRAGVPVFEPLAPAVAALTRRLKASFDPAGILNPGRMAAEF